MANRIRLVRWVEKINEDASSWFLSFFFLMLKLYKVVIKLYKNNVGSLGRCLVDVSNSRFYRTNTVNFTIITSYTRNSNLWNGKFILSSSNLIIE